MAKVLVMVEQRVNKYGEKTCSGCQMAPCEYQASQDGRHKRRFPSSTCPVWHGDALREALEKFAAWVFVQWKDDLDEVGPIQMLDGYLQDVRNGWKPEANDG